MTFNFPILRIFSENFRVIRYIFFDLQGHSRGVVQQKRWFSLYKMGKNWKIHNFFKKSDIDMKIGQNDGFNTYFVVFYFFLILAIFGPVTAKCSIFSLFLTFWRQKMVFYGIFGKSILFHNFLHSFTYKIMGQPCS